MNSNESAPINLAIIGCTGSVGSAVLDVCRAYPDKFRVHSLVACKSVEKMVSLAAEFRPEILLLTETDPAKRLRDKVTTLKVLSGIKALDDVVENPDVDHVVFASSGTVAIPALLRALSQDKNVSLANKESLVVAGQWVIPMVKRKDQLRPVDSEHNAIWQCLMGEEKRSVAKIYITASGGPFRNYSMEDLSRVTPEMAIRHPVWSMGEKISVDSATLMNKGLEIIEAMYLFGLDIDSIEAIIHPHSYVHGMVRFLDGNIKMLMAPPNMRLAASSALSYPERLPLKFNGINDVCLESLSLSFSRPDTRRFPGLALALEAGHRVGAYPAIFVGADEIAVEAFLRKKISFREIPEKVEQTMESYDGSAPTSLDDALIILDWARRKCRLLCAR